MPLFRFNLRFCACQLLFNKIILLIVCYSIIYMLMFKSHMYYLNILCTPLCMQQNDYKCQIMHQITVVYVPKNKLTISQTAKQTQDVSLGQSQCRLHSQSLSLKDSITRNYTSQCKVCYFSLYGPLVSLTFILDLREDLESK